MDTIKLPSSNAKIIAHRGLSGIERENTLAAFIAAGNRSYFGVETDIHRTADGKYAVIHDDDTRRVAGDYLRVEYSSLTCLRALALADMDGRKRPDLIIPTLEEYVSVCKKYGKTCVLELKNTFKYEDILEIADIIKELDYLSGVIFISFYPDNIIALRKAYPTQPVQFLTDKYSEEVVEFLRKYSVDLDIHYKALTQERIKSLHDKGIKVNCWTCDDKSEAEKLIGWGVDYITSNILE